MASDDASYSAPIDNAVAIEGWLLRSDRLLMASIIVMLLMLMVLSYGWRTPMGIGSLVIIAAVLGLYLRSRGQIGRQEARMTFEANGVRLRRAGHEVRAPWKYFESATIHPRSTRHGTLQRLTLQNRYKPSIASFIHPRASDEVIFHQQIVLDFYAHTGTIDRLLRMLAEHIREPVRQQPTVRQRSVRVEDLLHLPNCLRCDYPLHGLRDSSHCPECGWAFVPGSFLVQGIQRSGEWGSGVRLTVFAAVLMIAIMAVLVAPAIPCIMIFLGLIFAPAMSRRPCSLVVSPTGVEIWRRGSQQRAYSWEQIGEIRHVQSSIDVLRLTAWPREDGYVADSEQFKLAGRSAWLVSLFDVNVTGDPAEGRLRCEEIVRRWRRDWGRSKSVAQHAQAGTGGGASRAIRELSHDC